MQKIIVSKGYEKMAENKKLITADNSFLTYMGRIDFSTFRSLALLWTAKRAR